ncbi:MAG: helix-hairpin-helix domain-containing protein [bacterium]|nr:helix-hairpin-helix domain-containing protein [bacterium]
MMGSLNRYFDFSTGQLRFLTVLCSIAIVLALYLFVKTYATPAPDAPTLPVILGDQKTEYTGLFVLDPNTAPADSLELLPGIGRVLADRIVEYRLHSRFSSEIDITEVKGVGPKLFERIRPYLKVSRP